MGDVHGTHLDGAPTELANVAVPARVLDSAVVVADKISLGCPGAPCAVAWRCSDRFFLTQTNDDPAAVGWTSPMVLLYACLFVTHSILASAGVWPTRQLTTSSPEVLAMARARIKSFNGKSFMNRPLHPSSWVAHRGQGPVPGSYGSFGQSSTAPHDGTPSPLPGLAHTPVVVRVPKVKICIPSWTLSRRSEISYVSYKVLILSEGETWSVRRRYSDFAHLRSELPHWIRSGAAFPDKSLFKRFDPKRIDTRRAQLEAFLNVSPTWMLFTPNETVVHAACRGPSRL
ncbi:hypothetical protein, variant 21 [Aphanomyces invadans]|uniref:PX domain-containing protein n=1 Tax=Aphanomyces invadans TaxID=157072 RepID=A0A024TYF9_9STRA|nr:hypothetical protein, variant 21 [Aphanomyces invadans]ETV99048.1 hypothetical protein, variant 21 [Aphanomyces invadans]|eukprot:XP_008872476.1 hypothetical protein, variant 21 [Aphanomyces invadans]